MKTTLLENQTPASMTINVGEEVKNQIEYWMETNVFFGIFPIAGNSMTCSNNLKSIPDGSNVLAYDLEIDCSNPLELIWHKIPLGQTLLITGKSTNGKEFFVCKSISYANAVNNTITLHSYNPDFRDCTIPFSTVNQIFKVAAIV